MFLIRCGGAQRRHYNLQRFSIHFQARPLPEGKIIFAPLASFDVLFFVLSSLTSTVAKVLSYSLAEKFALQEVPSRSPWGYEHPQLRTAAYENNRGAELFLPFIGKTADITQPENPNSVLH